MTDTMAESTRSQATGELLDALIGIKSWLREAHQLIDTEHSAASLMMLAYLDRHGSVRVSELAEIARIDTSVVSRQAAHLEQQGLVERRPDPDDRRAHRLSLSPAGAQVLETGRTRLAAAVGKNLSDWTPGEIAAFSASLRRLLGDLAT